MSAGLVIEPARYAVTGGVPCGLALGLRADYIGTDSGPLDAPQYTPAGGLQVLYCSDNSQPGYAVAAVLREGVL